MTNVITGTHQFGVMRVYRREWKEPGLKRYVVMRMTDGHFLEEFSRFRDALRWAKKNREG